MANQSKQYDIIIVGGGMAGASLACALAPHGLQIAVVEAYAIDSDRQPSYDTRCIALSPASEQIYRAMGLGLWRALQQHALAIKEIHISEQQRFGSTRLSAQQQHLPALGWVIENQALGQILWQSCKQQENIHWLCPANLQDIETHDDYITAHIDHDGATQTLQAKLVIGADGAQSKVRQLSGIHLTEKDYGQTAIISTVSPQYKHQQVAYERFTKTGPLALLPLTDNRFSLVFTVNNKQVDEIMALNDVDFDTALLERFGFRLGHFIKMAPRKAYPLKLLRCKQLIGDRMALIGNAAHTIHPVAGQGFNLGMRDIAVLAELIVQATRQGKDIGEDCLLTQYQQDRIKDHDATIAFTDGLVKWFSNDWLLLNKARSKALGLTQLSSPARNKLLRLSMGYQHPHARMIRGLPL